MPPRHVESKEGFSLKRALGWGVIGLFVIVSVAHLVPGAVEAAGGSEQFMDKLVNGELPPEVSGVIDPIVENRIGLEETLPKILNTDIAGISADTTAEISKII